MTTYWCGWCGETAEADGPDERIPCTRCIREFVQLLGFWPEAAMTPLEPDEEPGVPMAAIKRFTFTDAQNGRVIGRTAVASGPTFGARRVGGNTA